METIQVSGGDIVISNSTINLVDGKDKLLQDLRLWLLEPLGAGFITKKFGSTLRGMIGSSNDEFVELAIQDEVIRVLTIYQNNQARLLRESQRDGTLARWSKSEILGRIVSVTTSRNLTTISVKIVIELLNQELITFSVEI